MYSSAPNLTRYAALKAENEELRSRHGKLTNIYKKLIHGTAEEVTSTLERLKSEGDISSLLNDERTPSQSADDAQSMGGNDRIRARSQRPAIAPVIDRLAMGKICPFNTVFDKPEAQWAADTAGDFDYCIEQAFSVLTLSGDAMPYGKPTGKQLVLDMYSDNLLLRVAGLVTGAAFPGGLGYRPSTRPFLCYFRFSVLGELHRRISMETLPTRSLVAIVSLLAGWEWVGHRRRTKNAELTMYRRMATLEHAASIYKRSDVCSCKYAQMRYLRAILANLKMPTPSPYLGHRCHQALRS